jgi:PrgI family protein
MQYKIPQNVGIEDKIVGPLTLRQLIIIAVGVGVSWVLFSIFNKLYELNVIEDAVIAMPGLLSVAFALIRINDLSLTKYIFLLLEFSIKPKKRMWDHRAIASLVAPEFDIPLVENPADQAAALEKSKKASNLSQLSLVLDSGGFGHVKEVIHRDMDVIRDDDLVTEAYFGNEEKEKISMYWRTTDSHRKMLDFFAKLPITQLRKGTPEVALAQQEIAKVKQEAELARKQAVAKKVTFMPSTGPSPTPSKEVSKPATPPSASRPPNPPVNPEKKPSLAMPPKPTPTPPPAPKPMGQKPAPNTQKPVGTSIQKPMAQKPEPKVAPPPSPQPKNQTVSNASSKPVRSGNHVDTTKKNAPAQYIPKPSPKTEPLPKPATPSPVAIPEKGKEPPVKTEGQPKGGEFKFEELKKGEIEINLD